MSRIQVRIRERGDLRDWKDILVVVYDVRADESDADIDSVVCGFAEERHSLSGIEVSEARWSHYIAPSLGLGQGHYPPESRCL